MSERTIKFRAWIKAANLMASWDQIRKECDRFSLLDNDGFIFMQYTGLKDKNGKEIYEGEILAVDDGYGLGQVYWCDKDLAWRISFDDGSYLPTSEFLSEFDSSGLEIIGNIHTNPELLT